jgi:replicative DNA helicase
MKRLAKDCEMPVLLSAQLNRGVEGRDDKRPGLGDLRQAGDIEQDADAVGFVYRPEYYLGASPRRGRVRPGPSSMNGGTRGATARPTPRGKRN